MIPKRAGKRALNLAQNRGRRDAVGVGFRTWTRNRARDGIGGYVEMVGKKDVDASLDTRSHAGFEAYPRRHGVAFLNGAGNQNRCWNGFGVRIRLGINLVIGLEIGRGIGREDERLRGREICIHDSWLRSP
jgi:hypothetical protein